MGLRSRRAIERAVGERDERAPVAASGRARPSGGGIMPARSFRTTFSQVSTLPPDRIGIGGVQDQAPGLQAAL